MIFFIDLMNNEPSMNNNIKLYIYLKMKIIFYSIKMHKNSLAQQ